MLCYVKHVLIGALAAGWVLFCSATILTSKELITHGFRFPCILALSHMLAVVVTVGAARACGFTDVPVISARRWLLRFVPVGACFAASLALSNSAYTYLSIPFIQARAALPLVLTLRTTTARCL